MSIEDRLAALEARVADLEEAAARPRVEATASTTSTDLAETFWALNGLRERLPQEGSGAVLFTGVVDLPTGEHYEWQQAHDPDHILEAPDRSWSDTAATVAALGHAVRLQLLEAILRGSRTAAELAELDGVGTTGQIYHHLRLLTSAGWLRTTGRGQYAVPPERVVPLLIVIAASRH